MSATPASVPSFVPSSVRRPDAPASRVPRVRALRVGLLGLGTVGQGLVELLAARRDDLARRHRVAFEVERVLVRDVGKPRRVRPPDAPLVADADAFVDGAYDVVVEAIGGVETAGRLVETFLRRGVPVVTANKALLAERVAELAAVAREGGASLRYEASVAAGIPLLGLLRRSLQSTTVGRVEAVLNATSHFATSRLERGVTLADALEDARRAGWAEADARLDTSGYDAAQKLSVLAWTLGGRSLGWTSVEIEGIEGLTPADAAAARAAGGRLKPVALVDLAEPTAWVAPAFVPSTHPIASLDGAQNGVRLLGDTIDDLFLSGPGAGARPTAAALLDDLLAVAAGDDDGARPPALASPAAAAFAAKPASPWWLALPGVAEGAIAGLCERAARADVTLVDPRVVVVVGAPWVVALTGAAPREHVAALSTRLAREGLSLRAFRALA